MARHGKKDIDTKLLMALACGATAEAAARALGVSERTVYRRLKVPEFCKRLQQLRADMVQRTAGALTAAGSEAVRTLLALQKETAPPAVRLQAARAVLELGVKMREIVDLEERVQALEEQLASHAGGQRW
jgi:hypothetical protein